MKHGSNKKEALLFQCDTLRVSSFVIERLRPAGGTRAVYDADHKFYCEVKDGSGKIITDQEGLLRVSFEVSVFNISPYTLDDVCVTLRLPEEMAYYLASGVLEMPTPFDRFYSEAEAALQSEGDMKAWGAIIGWAPMIMEASYLEEHDQEIEDILEIAKRIEVEITWDGGGETHSCEMKMENCLGK